MPEAVFVFYGRLTPRGACRGLSTQWESGQWTINIHEDEVRIAFDGSYDDFDLLGAKAAARARLLLSILAINSDVAIEFQTEGWTEIQDQRGGHRIVQGFSPRRDDLTIKDEDVERASSIVQGMLGAKDPTGMLCLIHAVSDYRTALSGRPAHECLIHLYRANDWICQHFGGRRNLHKALPDIAANERRVAKAANFDTVARHARPLEELPSPSGVDIESVFRDSRTVLKAFAGHLGVDLIPD